MDLGFFFVTWNHSLPENLEDSNSIASARHLNEKGLTCLGLRTIFKEMEVEPPFSITFANDSWSPFNCNQRHRSDSCSLDIRLFGAWFTISLDFSLPQLFLWKRSIVPLILGKQSEKSDS